MTTAERWRPLPEWPGYEVSDLGAVRCWRPRNGNARAPEHPRTVKAVIDSNGYLMFSVSNNGKVKRLTVHSAVLLAFVGQKPDGMEGAHIDGDRSNCRLTNLTYKTHIDNMRDREAHGTVPKGANHYNATINEEIARQIFLAPDIRAARSIARDRGITHHSAKSIRVRRSWKHATEGLVLGGNAV